MGKENLNEKVVPNGSDCFCEAQKMPADTPGSMSGMNFNYARKEEQGGWMGDF